MHTHPVVTSTDSSGERLNEVRSIGDVHYFIIRYPGDWVRGSRRANRWVEECSRDMTLS